MASRRRSDSDPRTETISIRFSPLMKEQLQALLYVLSRDDDQTGQPATQLNFSELVRSEVVEPFIENGPTVTGIEVSRMVSEYRAALAAERDAQIDAEWAELTRRAAELEAMRGAAGRTAAAPDAEPGIDGTAEGSTAR